MKKALTMKKYLFLVLAGVLLVCMGISMLYTFTLVDAYDCCTTIQSGEKLVILQKVNLDVDLVNRKIYYWWNSQRLIHTIGVALAEATVKNENQTHFAIRWGDGFKWIPKTALAGEQILCSLTFDLQFIIAILFPIGFFAVACAIISRRKEEENNPRPGLEEKQ